MPDEQDNPIIINTGATDSSAAPPPEPPVPNVPVAQFDEVAAILAEGWAQSRPIPHDSHTTHTSGETTIINAYLNLVNNNSATNVRALGHARAGMIQYWARHPAYIGQEYNMDDTQRALLKFEEATRKNFVESTVENWNISVGP